MTSQKLRLKHEWWMFAEHYEYIFKERADGMRFRLVMGDGEEDTGYGLWSRVPLRKKLWVEVVSGLTRACLWLGIWRWFMSIEFVVGKISGELRAARCRLFGHKIVNDGYATPDSGADGAHCTRCGWGFYVQLY